MEVVEDIMEVLAPSVEVVENSTEVSSGNFRERAMKVAVYFAEASYMEASMERMEASRNNLKVVELYS